MTYRVTISEAYEGDYSELFDTLEEAIEYIVARQEFNKYKDLGDYDIEEIKDNFDTYSLVAEYMKKKGLTE